MATLHTNQSRQLYVVNTIVADATTITDASAVGASAITGVDPATSKFGEAYGYVTQKGVDTIVRSDLVKEKDIVMIKHTAAASMGKPMRKINVSLDAAVNGGAPVAGQTYQLGITFREWIGVSPENQYYKFGAVYAYAGMTAAQFYLAMFASLQNNFKREPAKVLNFSLDNAVTPTMIIIEEVEQPWTLGLSNAATSKVNFEVWGDNILLNGDYLNWATVTEVTPTTIVANGKMIADMEYFYHGERGDIYRNVGWPNVWMTKYMVDPAVEYDSYDVVYNFKGINNDSYESRKVLTIVVPVAQTAAVATALGTAFPNVAITEAA
jgi:hypothetical protein